MATLSLPTKRKPATIMANKAIMAGDAPPVSANREHIYIKRTQAQTAIKPAKRNYDEPKFTPTLTLVETWVWMLASSKDPELMFEARQRIQSTFGSTQAAIEFIRKNK